MSSSCPQSHAPRPGASTGNSSSFFAATQELSLFNPPSEALPGSLNDAALVRAVLVDAIRKSGKSREVIAEQMSYYTGTEVTVRRLNGFTAESAEDYRFPAELERAFCLATNDYRLIACRAELAGFRVISETEANLLELGRQFLIRSQADAKVSLLQRSLAGVEL